MLDVVHPSDADPTSPRPFDRAAAMAALDAAALTARSCAQVGGPSGRARVKVVFAPDGTVTSASVEDPPFAGTPTGGCIASAFRSARVPPFDGEPVELETSVEIA